MKLTYRLKTGALMAAGILIPNLTMAQSATQSLPGSAPTYVTPPTTPPGTPKTSAPAPAPKINLQPPPPKPVAAPHIHKKEAHYPVENVPVSNYPEPQRPSYNDSQDILILIENQINAIQHHEINRAYNLYTSQQFKQVTNFEEFKYFVESFPVFSKNKNAIFGNLDIRPNGIATIQGVLTSTDGETLNVEYKFVREGYQWRIIGIQLLRPSYQPEIGPNPKSYDFQKDIE